MTELAAAADVELAVAETSVAHLADLDLLDAPSVGLNRRKFLRRSVLVGGTMAALPVIQTVLAPEAAFADSRCVVLVQQTG